MAQFSRKGVQILKILVWEVYLYKVVPNQIETYLVKTWLTLMPGM